VALAAALAWWWVSPGRDPAPVATAQGTASAPDGPVAATAVGGPDGPSAGGDAAGARSSGGAPAEDPEGALDAQAAEPEGPRMGLDVNIPPSTRAFATPEEASAFVEGKVFDLFAAVAPELDRASITKECSADGRRCTFEGPWPGDDFMKRWLHAIADGRTGPAAMDGVKFSKFSPVGDGEDRTFVIIAHAP
jgi:hypothetical protein